MVEFNLVPPSKEKGKMRFCLQFWGKKIIFPGLFFPASDAGWEEEKGLFSSESESAIKADSAYSLDHIKKKNTAKVEGELSK